MSYETDWTPGENRELIHLFYEKVPITQIGEKLGKSRDDINFELQALGIIKPGTPLQAFPGSILAVRPRLPSTKPQSS